ncbi:MAG: hypothetical protein K2H45_14210 [Acetatifactor sp.]|nr:hypothetical protein [Acetatifactor sp.]
MDVDAIRVYEIIAQNNRFSSPFSEENGYYIWTEHEAADESVVELYLGKLSYAVQNVDRLIHQAFLEFSSSEDLPEEMWRRLVFDSFVLEPQRKEISCCLTNSDFMFGHFIECRWDYEWNLLSVWYC